MRLLRGLLNILNRDIALPPSTLACSEPDRQLILADWGQARRHILLMGTLKFALWRQLPWVLIGVAHHSSEIAIECASLGLQLFDASPDETQHHWVTLLLCSVGSAGRAQLVAFINGASLQTLPLLQRMVARFKFIPIVERWIESRHALLKRQLHGASHASAVHVARSSTYRRTAARCIAPRRARLRR